ncbi:MAG TPA: hypothetical protein VFF76_08870 [Holophagaceae bacterium]|jgi:hypothetical protein|nr:hypothetical protein [Holophagaceae bacterium]
MRGIAPHRLTNCIIASPRWNSAASMWSGEHHAFSANPFNIRYLQTKAAKSGHLLDLG